MRRTPLTEPEIKRMVSAYVDGTESVMEIANRYHVSDGTVWRVLKMHGIERRLSGRVMVSSASARSRSTRSGGSST